MWGPVRATKELKTDFSCRHRDTMSFAFRSVSGSLSQRVDYLYAYNHRRFTTTDNGNEYDT